MIGRGELRERGRGWCKQHIKHMFFDILQLLRGFLYWKVHLKKNTKTKTRMVKYWTSLKWDCCYKFLEVPFIKSRQIYIYIYIYIQISGFGLIQTHLFATLSFMLLTKQSSGNYNVYLLSDVNSRPWRLYSIMYLWRKKKAFVS